MAIATHPDPASAVLLIDIEGLELTPEDRELLSHPLVAGVILFARNCKHPEQIQQLTRSIRAVHSQHLIAVDQEGGRVQRIKEPLTRLPPMRRFGDHFDREPQQALTLARQCGWLMAAEVQALGIDLSFAPVLDLDRGVSSVIGDRAFHSRPDAVVALARAFMAGMHDAGMATVGKHFPGHGSVAADSHLELPVDERDLEAIEAEDLNVFRQLTGEMEGIMPAHVLYPKMDARQPAGFSYYWLQTVLRQQLQYHGLIFSDDLAMAGAARVGGPGDRAFAALQAGCDRLLLCNDRQAVTQLLDDDRWYGTGQAKHNTLLAQPGRWHWQALVQDPQRIAMARQITQWQNPVKGEENRDL